MSNTQKNINPVVLNQVFSTEENLNVYKICASAFSKTTFRNCTFKNVTYVGYVFTKCNFENCRLTDVDLMSTEFEDSSFKNCTFIIVWWRFSVFSRCDFKEIQVKDSNLKFITSNQVKFWTPTTWIEITHDFTLDFEQLLTVLQQLK